MAKRSFIYSNIFIYRLMMNLLYSGKYRKRFDPVISHIKKLSPGTRVVELCFGDIYIAKFCKAQGYEWTGLDINTEFVQAARRLGLDAHVCDLTSVATLPKAGVCVMVGSMYHFVHHLRNLLSMMFAAADHVIISEPVINLSSSSGLIGWLARKGANAGRGHEEFRFTRRSLLSILEENSGTVGYRIEDVQEYGRDLIIKLIKNEKR